MKNQKGVSMITLIITIIVIIILAAIAFVASGNTVDSAQFSTFASEFSGYSENFIIGPMAQLEEELGLTGEKMTEAQKRYLSARNATKASVVGVTTPAGVSFTKNGEIAKLYNADGLDVTTELWGATLTANETTPAENTIACYQIKDSQIKGYKDNHKFYGDNLGKETHWVTEEGFVFTLPGFQREVELDDGTVEYRMYISPSTYYKATENYGDVINATEFVTVAAHVAEGGTANEATTAYDPAS